MTDGIILLAKPAGTTSFQALGTIKRSLGTRHIGHTGTLDRFAEGLLLVLAGRLTRLCPYASGLDKEYLATVTFGKSTDTLDPEGNVVAEGPIPDLEELQSRLPLFTGAISQVPPAFSAVHVDGKRAYQVARKGDPVVLKPRPVTVYGIELVSWSAPSAVLRISCSKGTYIRALARDIGCALGTCAYVSALLRARVGGFLLAQAVSPESFDAARDLLPAELFFDRCPGLSRLMAKDHWVSRIALGVPVREETFEAPPGPDGTYGVFNSTGLLLALVEKQAGRYRYGAVFAARGTE